MRNELQRLQDEQPSGPHHAGLAHERYAPEKDDKDAKISPWRKWLSWMELARQPEDYGVAYRRWLESLKQWHTATVTVRAVGRLLVGHGMASPTGVGLTLHHTWGVPMIPGSSLKGVLASYLRAKFEPVDVAEACRRLFGVPGDEATGTAASAGQVVFHDALWVHTPAEVGMLSRDVLTVHQRSWYEGRDWPNDYDSPNPVAFLSVRPGGRFLVALSLAPGADEDSVRLLTWAAERLREALSEWGVGGKTAAGYGRLTSEEKTVIGPPRAVSRPSPLRDEFRAWVEARREDETVQRKVLDEFEASWLERLSALPLAAREECAQAVRSLVKKNPKLQERRDALLARLALRSGTPAGSQ
ncbi:type III-B CRISPR module RAMP protein Cmr6 [Myxococcus sp. CA033]|uniref:type III-B CRISPR module RAMP protein Cmr6 n=1 Tax=Myxococcus sp. CA033 TaxID=2741516 RepID=UPI00157B69A8|nr:type III-B CRISPR module RAMP protein Cmr6 [Myxococcus sp. CA033]NTX41315.1 type III-B CRISPR module RAMP protein Cmr6 [Myxococcus sp. CA033]